MKLLDLIVCDDIRPELGNKVSLMGLYSNLIIDSQEGVCQWPQQLRLGFFARCKTEHGDVQPDAFQFEFIRNGETISSVQGTVA